ncbi:MAG TPA: hypothetical protein V6D05_01640 [Stenomitos sp.]
MITQTDLITGERSYTLSADSLTISLLGRAKGEVHLTCTPEGELTGFEAIAHPAPFLVRQKAEALAEAATWELQVNELSDLPDNTRITLRLSLGEAALSSLKAQPIWTAEEAAAVIQRAQDEPASAWKVEDIEVEV